MVSSNDFQKAVELIGKSDKILITTHTKPDGDACGSVTAICEVLTSIGKTVKPLLLSELPEWYAFLFAEKPAIFGEDISVKELKANNFDLIILVDVDSENQLDKFAEYLKRNDAPVLVIDHHITGDGLGDVELVDTSAAASGLIVFDLMKYAGWAMTSDIARSLFVAISTDTGWFRFTNTDGKVLRCAAELIDGGVNPSQICHQLYQNFSAQRFKLMTKMLNTLQLHFDGKYAEQHLLQCDFKETAATSRDTENLIDECRRIRTVEAAALFVELPDGRIKCSLRSRGQVDVRLIAQKFGGGGHTMAAGVHLDGPLEKAKKLILAEVKNRLEK